MIEMLHGASLVVWCEESANANNWNVQPPCIVPSRDLPCNKTNTTVIHTIIVHGLTKLVRCLDLGFVEDMNLIKASHHNRNLTVMSVSIYMGGKPVPWIKINIPDPHVVYFYFRSMWCRKVCFPTVMKNCNFYPTLVEIMINILLW